MKHFVLLILLVLLIAACEKNDNVIQKPDLSLQPEYLEPMYFGFCFGGLYPPNSKEIIIKTNAGYQLLGDSCRVLTLCSVKCDTANLPEIDFKQYSLIGKYTQGGGCEVEYNRYLDIDTVNKVYNYTIEVDYESDCDMLIMNMNWALVPTIPDSYTVSFHVKNQ